MVHETDVIVIGSGCVAAGIARDLAMRGVSCLLLRQPDPAWGFTSRCRGVVDSGALMALTDPVMARECSSENRILRYIASHLVEETGGLIVRFPEDAPAPFHHLQDLLRQVGIPAKSISAEKARDLEPALAPDIAEAILVHDMVVSPATLALANVRSAIEHGAHVRENTSVQSLLIEDGKVKGVRTRCDMTGDENEYLASCVVNASISNPAALLAMAKIVLPLVFTQLNFVVMDTRLTRRIVHRFPSHLQVLHALIPGGTQTAVRKTRRDIPDTEMPVIGAEEVDQILEGAWRVIPGAKEATAIRAFAVTQAFTLVSRPSLPDRTYADTLVVDHGLRDGVAGFYTVIGAMLTTYRRAAKIAADAVCRKVGNSVPCTTHGKRLPEVADVLPDDFRNNEADREFSSDVPSLGDEIVCQCMGTIRRDVEKICDTRWSPGIAGLQHRTGSGTGPCQGGLCAVKMVNILQEKGLLSDSDRPHKMLQAFLEERWKGVRPVLWGKRMREEELIRALMQETFNLDGEA